MSDSDEKSATLTLKLRAKSGYSADMTAEISPNQWSLINQAIGGQPTDREEKLEAALRTLAEQADGFNVSGVYFNEMKENRAALNAAWELLD